MYSFENYLTEGAAQLGIEISPSTAARFFSFYSKVISCNKKFNLTAITDEREFIVKHFLDSLTAARYISEGATVCDIGAGAGFPSIPLKLVRNDISFVLLDALNKRVNFLNETINSLKIKNTTAVHMRAEDAARTTFRSSFDFVIARAVANINTLCELAVPLVKEGGTFIAYKGSNLDETDGLERTLALLNCRLTKTVNLQLPYIFDERNMLFIKKIKPTPEKYPRPFSQIKKSPLCGDHV